MFGLNLIVYIFCLSSGFEARPGSDPSSYTPIEFLDLEKGSSDTEGKEAENIS